MANEELLAKIMEWFETKSKGAKKKFYMRDIVVAMGELDYKKRDVQKGVNALITDDKLMYWSSGSTTMLCLPQFHSAPNE